MRASVFACSLLPAAASELNLLNVFTAEEMRGADAQQLSDTFKKVYQGFNNTFDHKGYQSFLKMLREGSEEYRESDAFTSYSKYPDRPHCDKGVASGAKEVSGLSVFPGGITVADFKDDFTKEAAKLSEDANGPAGAGLSMSAVLTKQAYDMGLGLVRSAVASAIHTIPPLVGPPVWNNMPLACVPMVSGHNCFGAVLYPITMADFSMADVTDSMLDGVIAGFPNTYATKVGKTSDDMYKRCFASYMSMHCSAIFPRCTTPQSRDEPMPVGGRVPMCLHLCVVPLVMCPGFWFGDIIGTCSMVSVPPMCTQALFWNTKRLPPQYSSFDEANPYSPKCPETDYAGLDADEDPSLYDASAISSPILGSAGVTGPSIQ